MAKDELSLEQIIHQQQQEQELFFTGPVLTFIWQPKRTGNVLQVSKNVTDILGYTPEEMTSPSFTYDKIVHPKDVEKVRSESAKYREKGMRRYHQSYRLKTKSGCYRWFFDQTQCIEDAGGTIIEHRGYLVDQTPLKEAEANLEEEIGTAMAPLWSVARQKDIHLLVTMDNNLPNQVEGDPQRLRQIILNLGSNG